MNRLTFHPYKFDEVQQILQHRLNELQLEAFDSSCIQFMARKAETVGGDLRAALKICQRTIELFRDQLTEEEKQQQKQQQITDSKDSPSKKQRLNESSTNTSVPPMSQLTQATKPKTNFQKIALLVNKAIDAYKQNPFIAVVSRATQLEKIILIILVRSRKHDDTENPDAIDSEKGLMLFDISERVLELVGTILNEQ